MNYKGFLKLFKQKDLPLVSVDNNCKKKSKSSIKKTKRK